MRHGAPQLSALPIDRNGDGSVATREFWLHASLEAGELAGVTFASPLRAPSSPSGGKIILLT